MARGEGSRLEAAMAEVLSEEAIAEAADRFGVVKRQRKVHPFFLVWTLVLGHRIDPDRTFSLGERFAATWTSNRPMLPTPDLIAADFWETSTTAGSTSEPATTPSPAPPSMDASQRASPR